MSNSSFLALKVFCFSLFRFSARVSHVSSRAWPGSGSLPARRSASRGEYWPGRSGWRRPGTRSAAPGWCPWRLASRPGSRFRWWCGRWWWAAAPSPRGCAAEEKTLSARVSEDILSATAVHFECEATFRSKRNINCMNKYPLNQWSTNQAACLLGVLIKVRRVFHSINFLF